MVESKFAHFLKTLRNHGVDTSNYRLEVSHARYRVIEIILPSYAESNPFGIRVRNAEDMWTTMDFAEEALRMVWKETRARYDISHFDGGKVVIEGDLPYHEAKIAQERIQKERMYSVYMIERD
jgi:hypothetical protein